MNFICYASTVISAVYLMWLSRHCLLFGWAGNGQPGAK